MEFGKELHQQVPAFQRKGNTEHHIYRRLAISVKPGGNRRVLKKIAEDELRHHRELKRYSDQDVPLLATGLDLLPDGVAAWICLHDQAPGAK